MSLFSSARPDLGLFFLRITAGSMMAFGHGFGKFQRLIAGKTDFADPLGIGEPATLVLAVFAEFVCALAVVVGFKTRLAALFPALTMVVAFFLVHGSDPWGKKELALCYAVMFIVLSLAGGGAFALDRRRP